MFGPLSMVPGLRVPLLIELKFRFSLGTTVTITGTGFSSLPNQETGVRFNGTAAAVSVGAGIRSAILSSPDPEDKRDPETHLRGIDHFANFMRFLVPVAPLPQDASIHRGMEIFTEIGCGACHVPELLTGSNDIVALDH